jgi:hypothetical protein
VYRLDRVSSFKNTFMYCEDRLIRIDIRGVGQGLPSKIAFGEKTHAIQWTWKPQFYILKVLREQSNLRFSNQGFDNFVFPSLWSFWLVFRLVRNGINPLRGLISGRSAKIVNERTVQIPNFLPENTDLVIMRTAGKQGLLLNDYATFLEVKIVRGGTGPIVTDFNVKLLPKKITERIFLWLMPAILPSLINHMLRVGSSKRRFKILRRILFLFPDWHPYKYSVWPSFGQINYPLFGCVDEVLKTKTELGELRMFAARNVILNGGQIISSERNSSLNLGSQLNSRIPEQNWPNYFWKFSNSNIIHSPRTIFAGVKSDYTFVSCVNNLHHFLEDTLPQIEANNIYSPSKPIFIRGNLDPILEEMARAVSLATVFVARAEEHFNFEKLTFFELSDYRARLLSGEILDIFGHASLIRSGLKRFVTQEFINRKPNLKIFVVRRRGLQRRLVNSRYLMNNLKRNGFILVEFESMTLQERVDLMSNCAVLVGETGAGLAHAYFLNPESEVIEIRHPLMNGSLEHQTLTQVTGLKYSIVNGDTVSKLKRLVFGNDAFKVNLDLLPENITRQQIDKI